MAFGLHVADHGLDGGAAAQFALDGAEHAALLAGDEDAVWVGGVVAAVSLVDIARSISRPVSLSVPRCSRAVCDRRKDCRAAPWRAARTGRPGLGRWW